MKISWNEISVATDKKSSDPTDFLKELCNSDDKLLDAVMFMILLEPSRQIPQLGGEEALLKAARAFEEKSNTVGARINYETLAKVSFYRSRPEEAKGFISKCEKIATNERREKYRFILQNFEKVFDVVKRFYDRAGERML